MSRIKKIIDSKIGGGQSFKSPPLVVPSGCVVPETANQTMARLMLNSGLITQDDYNKMLGVRFDVSSDEEIVFDDYVDDYDDEDFDVSDLVDFDDLEEAIAGDGLVSLEDAISEEKQEEVQSNGEEVEPSDSETSQ